MAIKFLNNVAVDSDVLYVDTVNDRVGIGTTSPSRELDVDGNIQLSDPTFSSVRGLYGPNGPLITFNGFNFDTLVAGGTIRYNPVAQEVNLTVGGTDEFLRHSRQGGYTTFTNNNSERMRITSSGNVGIGTTNPTSKLTVVDDILLTGSSPSLTLTDATSSFVVKTNTAGEGILQTSGTSKPIRFFRNNGSNESMRINGNGNVGIGTTSPKTGLHLSSGVDNRTVGGTDVSIIRLTNTYGSAFGAGGEIQFGLQDVSGRDVLSLIKGSYTGYDSGNYGGDLEFHTRKPDGLGLQQRMTITNAGNVGIGTTSPQSKLHVANGTLRTWTPTSGTTAIFESTANSRSFITITGANESELWFGDGTTQAKGRVRYENNNDMMEFWTAQTAKMYINSAGNVGIGTTNPQSKLHVSGAIQNDQFVIPNTAGTSGQVLKWPASGTTLEWGDASGGGSYTPSIISANTNAVKDYLYVLTASLTLTLPASPSAGDSIKIANLSGVTTCVIGRNGSNIMATAENMTLDDNTANFELIYTNATQGWVVIGAN